MKVSFLGTSDELEHVAGRPTLILLGLNHLPRLTLFTLFHPRILRHPYRDLYRLQADMAPLDERGRA
ncbi:hypothetical protein [Nonomuraea typhae]|uniref:hypothetical protein n=1 Tax=Nonomuraea typhae TaxID=2603600 RepID=UPI0012F85E08|nr:hypothetical protein [Nonomuraea typhae]